MHLVVCCGLFTEYLLLVCRCHMLLKKQLTCAGVVERFRLQRVCSQETTCVTRIGQQYSSTASHLVWMHGHGVHSFAVMSTSLTPMHSFSVLQLSFVLNHETANFRW